MVPTPDTPGVVAAATDDQIQRPGMRGAGQLLLGTSPDAWHQCRMDGGSRPRAVSHPRAGGTRDQSGTRGNDRQQPLRSLTPTFGRDLAVDLRYAPRMFSRDELRRRFLPALAGRGVL